MSNREQQLALVALAARAPSPHNIQPARWRFSGDAIELWEDGERWLSVGDPGGRDNRISLGMAWEGMAIALSGENLHLEMQDKLTLAYPVLQNKLRLAVAGRLSAGASADPLLPALNRRKSYRGKFEQADESQRLNLESCLATHRDIAFVLPESASAQLADWYDRAAAEGLESPEFAKELYRWMRFSPRQKDWSRDGLTTDCMSLSGFEAWAASMALKPSVVSVLSALSLTRFLVSEADKVKAASRLIAIHAPADADAFDIGRAWYRFWLALDNAGFAGVPMSALSDSVRYSKQLLDAWPLPSGQKLVNVMRVGPIPHNGAARSARLPTAELLLE
jgi:hypothetical protein